MKQSALIFWVLFGLLGCGRQSAKHTPHSTPQPQVSRGGVVISFPDESIKAGFFATSIAAKEDMNANYQAPASVAVSVLGTTLAGMRSNVMFDDPDLGATYAQFLQHLVNISTYRVNLARVKDLYGHSAATGKEVLEAETQLANEEAAITEQEAKLRIAGLDPEALRDPRPTEAWLLCEVPESQIGSIRTGAVCRVRFTAYPNEILNATVNGLAAEVDAATRMVKVRVVLPDKANRYRVGMFATVTFALHEGDVLSVPLSSLVNVQGKDYVFVQNDSNTYERREVLIGQQVGDRVTILTGIGEHERVVYTGVMALKGISFGY
ncbi:MAG: efflux RND transporter periplasmic adaptor subunit [Cyclobacteriaceae bacterium]|jgi:multidrug efflux pump subunit AcrA (membrane-fusion protein)|nr:efflux RND transporter periplasmic adaptor subunit [Cyclobacteriaceae bacterium]